MAEQGINRLTWNPVPVSPKYVLFAGAAGAAAKLPMTFPRLESVLQEYIF